MIYFLVIILAAGLLLYAVVLAGSKSSGPKRGKLDRALVRTRWAAIKTSAESGPTGLKNAITEADKLLDYAMRESGFSGATMGERLKSAKSRSFTDLNAIWSAHKLRNSLAHDIGFDLVSSQAKEALRSFERGLRDLGAL